MQKINSTSPHKNILEMITNLNVKFKSIKFMRKHRKKSMSIKMLISTTEKSEIKDFLSC